VRRATALRPAIAVAVLVVAGLLAASAYAAGGSERNLPALNSQVLAAINAFRVAHGLATVTEARGLDRSARQHSREMGKDGYFAHASHDGTAFWKRIQHYYPVGHYALWTVGENLLWSSPTVSAANALKLWIASPPHLKNLMDPRWHQIGVSAVHVVDAPGYFRGHTVTVITTDFGVRS
jgi:uncharacterized protein YkwD